MNTTKTITTRVITVQRAKGKFEKSFYNEYKYMFKNKKPCGIYLK